MTILISDMNKINKFFLILVFILNFFIRFYNLGFNPSVRKISNENFITDSGNLIVDLHLNKIEDSFGLEREIKMMQGVVEVGLFNNIADTVIVGKEKSTEIFSRK